MRPHFHQNIFNTVDHAISNNYLEQWLQTMQILQLVFGLINHRLKLTRWAATTIYMLIFATAVLLSLTALSGELSKYVHRIYLRVEPCVREVRKRLGCMHKEVRDVSKARSAHAKRSRRDTTVLLGVARAYEQDRRHSAVGCGVGSGEGSQTM